MFKTTTALSVLSGLLLAAAFARPVSAGARVGGVELVSLGAVDADEVGVARLTITGLDSAYRGQVELPSEGAAGSVRVELPAGLYAIDAAASLGEDEVIPALSAPKLVVVAAGQVTRVNVRSDEARGAAVALGGASER